MNHPENQDWQKACRVCGKVKCPKPEKVAHWLRDLLTRTHEKHLQPMKGSDWRFLIAAEEATIDASLSSWAHALEGVCPDCLEAVAPEEHRRFLDGEPPHADAFARWEALVSMNPRTP